MKRPNSSDSLMGDKNAAFLDDEMGCDGEDELSSQVGAAGGSSGMMGSCEKKRRLSMEQVKALEKNFEVENKLEPERKVKLAMELGLQTRQVAVWFQNRRARWKTKQLERDYSVLKSSYDSLKFSYDALRGDKDTLLAEIRELKVKLGMFKEETFAQEELPADHKKEADKEAKAEEEEPPGLIYKDGSSDSDSSAILNDENSPNHFTVSSSQGIFSGHYQLEEEEHDKGMFIGFQQYAEEKTNRLSLCYFPPQHARAEDHSLLGGEEPCGTAFFSDEPPAMPWYCSEQWS